MLELRGRETLDAQGAPRTLIYTSSHLPPILPKFHKFSNVKQISPPSKLQPTSK